MDVTVDTLIEFLEVAIHGILYSRQIYPSGIFVKRKKYNIPVHVSIHPDLNNYITKCLSSIKPLLERNSVKAIAVTFLDTSHQPVQRLLIELSELCGTLNSCDELAAVEQALRACCMRINMSDSLIVRLPKGCTFIIQAHTDDNTLMDVQHNGLFNEDFPWIISEWNDPSKTSEIVPLKSAKTSMFKLQLLVEQNRLVKDYIRH